MPGQFRRQVQLDRPWDMRERFEWSVWSQGASGPLLDLYRDAGFNAFGMGGSTPLADRHAMRQYVEGATINTPSLLCIEDYLAALSFVESIGGLKGAIARADANAGVIANWVTETPWVEFLASDPATRSNTSVCLKVTDPQVTALPADAHAAFTKRMARRLEAEGVAFDIAAYRAAPPGLRIWTGATVERSDVEALMPWLNWAFQREKEALAGTD